MSVPPEPGEAARPKSTAMIEARRRDGATKRARVLAVVEQMAACGTPITFAEVARTAGVSSWLVYHSDLREAIEVARSAQAGRSRGAPAAATTAGLSTDLALARVEIARLRAERDDQRRQLSLALGGRMDDLAKADLVARIDEVTRHNTDLAAALARQQSEGAALKARVVELEDDLAAARTSLRRMIRAENSAPARP